MDLSTGKPCASRGVSDRKLQKSRSRGCPPPHRVLSVVESCPDQGVAPQVLKSLASPCTLPATGSSFSYKQPKALFEANRHSLHAGAGVRPLWGSGGRGRRAKVQTRDLFSPHTDPHPISAHRRPGTLGSAPTAQPQSARASASQFRPAHPRTTAPARRACRPSPSMAHYLTVPTPVPRRPLRGLAQAGAPGTERPSPGRRPRSRDRLLPAGYSTWVRVTGRHEAGSEHCPSAAILPGDRASSSSQWGARGAVVLTYHAGEAPCTQSVVNIGSGAAIQRAGRGAGPSGESESGAPGSQRAGPAGAQSGASAGRRLANQRRGGFQHRTGSITANQKVKLP